MRDFTNIITLSRNNRGCYYLDTVMGCPNGILNNNKGCYGICYASRICKSKGYNFNNPKLRFFENTKHFKVISEKLSKLDFIRIGCLGDPSFDWEHTLYIASMIKPYIKNVVIVTKHIKELTKIQLRQVKKLDLIINTSISALDSYEEIERKLHLYFKLKDYCKSILRVNTAKFNIEQKKLSSWIYFSEENKFKYIEELKRVQDFLLSHDKVIDNILRFPKSHSLKCNQIISITKQKFLGKEVYTSIHNKETHFSFCKDCKDKCGVNL